MTYYGWGNKKVSDIAPIYKTLQEALFHIPENKPFRGPEIYKQNDFIYLNKFEGDINQFSGEETITHIDGVELYKA